MKCRNPFRIIFHNKTNTAALTAAVCTHLLRSMQMPRGSSAKREHEYDKLKTEFKKEHRYPGREDELAARIVNKQRKRAGETKDSSWFADEPQTHDQFFNNDSSSLRG